MTDRDNERVLATAPRETRVGDFASRALSALALLVAVVVVWQLRAVVLLVFAGILFAIIFDSGARIIERGLHIGHRLSLVIATLLIVAATVAAIVLFGGVVVHQVEDLVSRLPAAWAAVENRITSDHLEDEFQANFGRMIPGGDALLGIAQFIFGGITSAASGAALALLGGIYFAARPNVYRDGFLLLLPDRHLEKVERSMDATHRALRAWLLGQLLSMALTAIAITIGLYALGVPSALALGLICGLMGFVPMIGPLLGALPGVLVALTIGGDVLIQTVLLYFIVQQLAGSVVEPLIMQRTVNVPPAVTLFGLFAIGILLGPVGVVLGGPLIVALHVMTGQLYVKGTLGRELPADTS